MTNELNTGAQHWWNDADSKNLSTGRENCPSNTLSATKLT